MEVDFLKVILPTLFGWTEEGNPLLRTNWESYNENPSYTAMLQYPESFYFGTNKSIMDRIEERGLKEQFNKARRAAYYLIDNGIYEEPSMCIFPI